MATTKPAALPKTLAGCADRLYQVREQRYALNRQVKVLEEEEALLRDHLINQLPKGAATGVTGRLARATIVPKTVYTAEDWAKVNAWVLEEHAKHKRKKDGLEMMPFTIFQRRLNESLVKEVLDTDGALPAGVGSMDVKQVSVVKAG